jgi:hypothetical protein
MILVYAISNGNVINAAKPADIKAEVTLDDISSF